ncbi:hypothetical protein JZ751_016159 [Albula glossodonta]|uniref:Uncharacterized protein n=1 Tax=Albula glossodonta TaxID=121402 RepID=A0A8T2MIM0_9TELE|nr:hypothetical protein JZ751_016159 [Albula glossodonta]
MLGETRAPSRPLDASLLTLVRRGADGGLAPAVVLERSCSCTHQQGLVSGRCSCTQQQGLHKFFPAVPPQVLRRCFNKALSCENGPRTSPIPESPVLETLSSGSGSGSGSSWLLCSECLPLAAETPGCERRAWETLSDGSDLRTQTFRFCWLGHPTLVKVVTGLTGDDSALKMKIRVGGVQRPARTSGRKGKAKVLRPPALPSPRKKRLNFAERTAGWIKQEEAPGPTADFWGIPRQIQELQTAHFLWGSFCRMFVWRSLLHLPENHSAFSSLTAKGVHSAFLTLHQRYPIKSQKLHRGLQRVLSAMAYWSAIFGETDYLPLVAFPFVKLFQNNPLICFEVVATVTVNWCQHWFEYFPNRR